MLKMCIRDRYAALHENSLGKTECWYVLDCKEDTKMVMGHHAKDVYKRQS